MSTTAAARPGRASPPAGGTAKRGRRGLALVCLLLLVASVAGGAAWWFLLRGPQEAPTPEPGEVLALEPISLNLAEGRYLKVSLGLQLTAEAEEPDGSKALDIAIDFLSGRRVEELQHPDSRSAIKAELATAIGEAYEGQVMEVLFTELVTQ